MSPRILTPSLRRRLAAGSVSGIGVALLAVPLFDVYDDVTNLGWNATSTLAENAVLFVLSFALVAGGVWLARREWESTYVSTVAVWTLAGVFGMGAVYAWVLLLQLWAMHGLKPYVITLDGVLLGTVAMFVAGVYRARSQRKHAELQAERDQFAGLFENTTDAIATVALTDDDHVVSQVNAAFEETFDREAQSVLADAIANLESESSQESALRRVRNGESFQTELTRLDGDERKSYLVQLVPYDSDPESTYIYVVISDITDQKHLARERASNARLTMLYDMTTDLMGADSHEELHDTAVDVAANAVDADGARLELDGEVVARTRESRAQVTDGGVAADAGTDAADGVLSVRVDDRGELVVEGADASPAAATGLEILAEHLDRSLDRLDRERQLAEEREQLEFINRIVRHNLLNDLQVVRARLEMLADDVDAEADGETADHRAVVEERTDDMIEFVQRMRTYMKQLVERDDHALTARPLGEVVRSEVSKLEDGYPDAEVVEDVPDVEVPADRLLGPVFENLLTNAVEHNDRETPRVRVGGECDDGTVTVCVADNGPGIADDRKGEILEKGERGVESPGTGFGLYLVSQATDTYGGDVEIEDNDPLGTVFRVTLPVA